MSKSIKGKIGFCFNKVLSIKPDKPYKDKNGKTKIPGHYVYIRNMDKNKNCDVNTITSLEDKSTGICSSDKIKQVKKGYVYPIPKYDSNFTIWSGVKNKSIKNVPVKDIQNIGQKKIKKRHRFFIGKFLK